MGNIKFFSEDIHFGLKNKKKIAEWINRVLISEHVKISVNIDFVFCSDQFLLNINQTYLKHNFFTDIISFDLSDDNNHIDGEVYISIDRVRENGLIFGSTFENELRRVIIHGVLHIIGYKDMSRSEIKKMRQLENKYLKMME
jgi:probable rRNA maturation factor